MFIGRPSWKQDLNNERHPAWTHSKESMISVEKKTHKALRHQETELIWETNQKPIWLKHYELRKNNEM